MQTLEPSPKAAPGFVSRLDGVLNVGLSMDTEDPRWRLALRIAASGSLGRSELLSDFLLYIVDRSIRGRTEDITEQRIGVTVFGRAEGYDPNDDNIVRSYARKLRKRIEEYFSGEGRDETLRLQIPRGGYTPIFTDVAPPSNRIDDTSASGDSDYQNADMLGPIAPERPEPTRPLIFDVTHKGANRFRVTPGVILALLMGMLVGVGLMLLRHSRLMEPRREALSHVLWKQLFSRDRDTFIVPSDDGLIVMQRLTERPVPLTAYVNGSYRSAVKTDGESNVAEILKLGGRRFTAWLTWILQPMWRN